MAPFYAVLSGKARIETANDAYDLMEGDFLVFPNGEAHELAGTGSAGVRPVPLLSLFADAGIEPWRPGMRFRAVHLSYGGGGPKSVLLVGLFFFGDPRTNPLLTALPSALVVRSSGTGHEAAGGRTILDTMVKELAEGKPASSLVIAKLADLLFVRSLRDYLATDLRNSVSWMRGITDPLVGRAISLMHAAPERPWTLQSLAEEVGSSRAVFAQRFSMLVGQGALTYLTAWRMHIAAGLLLEGTVNIRSVANRVGYQSEAAFSKMFRRWAGLPPSQYRAAILRNSPFASTPQSSPPV